MSTIEKKKIKTFLRQPGTSEHKLGIGRQIGREWGKFTGCAHSIVVVQKKKKILSNKRQTLWCLMKIISLTLSCPLPLPLKQQRVGCGRANFTAQTRCCGPAQVSALKPCPYRSEKCALKYLYREVTWCPECASKYPRKEKCGQAEGGVGGMTCG